MLCFSRGFFLVCVCLFFPFLPALISAVTRVTLTLALLHHRTGGNNSSVGVSVDTGLGNKNTNLEHSTRVEIYPTVYSAINME